MRLSKEYAGQQGRLQIKRTATASASQREGKPTPRSRPGAVQELSRNWPAAEPTVGNSKLVDQKGLHLSFGRDACQSSTYRLVSSRLDAVSSFWYKTGVFLGSNLLKFWCESSGDSFFYFFRFSYKSFMSCHGCWEVAWESFNCPHPKRKKLVYTYVLLQSSSVETSWASCCD